MIGGIKKLSLLALVFFVGPSVDHFKYQRPVQLAEAGQHYMAVDETTWAHARRDLGDLRLYASGNEIPYALSEQRGSSDFEHKKLRVLQQSLVGGKTRFLIDMSAVSEYQRITLQIDSRNFKDFIAHAIVEGSDDRHAKRWAALGDNIVYDLSKENGGSSGVLRLPRTTFRYLRVTIDGPVKPDDVRGATADLGEERPAVWRDVSSAMTQEQRGKDTVLKFQLSGGVPVEQVKFSVDPAQRNFRRDVEVRGEKDAFLASGEITRVHMVRDGQKVDSEHAEVGFAEHGDKIIVVIIHNGDDPPLRLTGAHLQQFERRIYFDFVGPARLALYYGDDKLQPPVYDYAKLFERDKHASVARLGAEAGNAQYTGRPDDRPWTERHPLVLWIAIVAAVVVLAGVALRSMRTQTAQSNVR